MGCCFSKKTSPSSSSSPPSGGSSSVKPPEPTKSAIYNSTQAQEKLEVEESKPINEAKHEAEVQENDKTRKEVFVIQHRRSHERSKTTDPEDSPASDDKSTGSNQNPVDVDAILIQCGRMSRSNSAAAKTRRYSGSKRSFDFDQNNAEEADAEDGGEEEEEVAERRIHRNRHRGGDSPRERRRRTPSREREESKSYRSGSRERGGVGSNNGGGSRRVSRSPGRRSDLNSNPNSSAVSGNSVNSNNNNKPAKFVSVPATEKINNNGEPSNKRITVKRNTGKATASPRSQSPARAASPRSQSPSRAAASYTQPSPSKLSRKTEHSPYRRNPLVEIDTNSLTIPPKKKMTSRESETTQGLVTEPGHLMVTQKLSTKTATQALTRRTVSPSRVTKEAVEECKIMLSSKPQVMSRSRSLRKSRDFDFSPEALLSNNVVAAGAALPSYTALLLEDIQNFHQKSVNVNVNAISSSFSKACSIVEAVSDLNSSTNQHQRTELNDFTSAVSKKADLMEPSFEKYVTVKRGGCSSSLEDMEAQEESSGSNSCVVQRHGNSWEPSSVESSDRVSVRSSKQERYFGVSIEKQEFDPLKKNGVGDKRVSLVDSSSSKQTKTTTITTRVGVVSV